MAFLHPESDLSMSIITFGASIIRILHKEKSPIIVDNLLDKFLKQDMRYTVVNFFSALEFLYTVGAIESEGYQIKLLKISDHPDLFDNISSGLPHA